MTLAASISPQRIRATPYARRLARDRKLPLAAIAGTGPNGRITAVDLRSYSPAVAAPAVVMPAAVAAKSIAAEPSAAATVTPAAIVARVEFAALGALLAQIAEVNPGVSREDICLKAAALALQAAGPLDLQGAIVLLAAPNERRRLAGLAEASVGAISAIRERADSSGGANLAVSFIGRAGIRPVAAQLIAGVVARLVIGAPERDGSADCLLSYDPTTLGDDVAEDYLAAFRDLVETPLRLLV
jgi:hypothetical protein